MRILILSHTRCGSTTLCKWLAKELNFELDANHYDYKTFDSVFQKNNIIRKIVIEEYFPTKEDISKFDKIIYLLRENSIEAAISFIIATRAKAWHIDYEVNKDWLELNKVDIEKRALMYDYYKSKLKNYIGFNTAYENLYLNKKDIPNMLEYLDIRNPEHLYYFDIDKKYRKDNNIFDKPKNTKLI